MGYIRLTLAELRRHVRHVNAENDAWGSNRAFGPINEIASYTEAFEGRA
jgi:hypothetical protein